MKTIFQKLLLVSSLSLLICLVSIGAKAATSITVTSITGGLASSPLDQNQTGVALFGFSVAASGGTASITAFTFTASQNISNYFASVSLYTYSTSTFPGTGSATLLKTVTSPNSTTLSITGLSQSITSGSTKYYYLVVDYTIPSAAASFKFTFTGVTGVSYSGGSKAGTNYTLTAPLYLGTATTSGFASDPLDHNQTGVAILGFSVTTDQSLTITTLNLYSTQSFGNIGTYFSNLKLFTNTANNFTGSSQVTGVTFSSLNSNTLTITGLSQAVNSTTRYYFIMVDYTVVSSASDSFQLSASSASTSSTTYSYGGPIDGNNYTVSSGTLNWSGAHGNAWNQANNWTEGRVPSTYDYAQFAVTTQTSGSNSVAVISSSTTIAGLIFAGNFSSGGTNFPGVSVNSGVTLTVNGDITYNTDSNPGTYNYTANNGTYATNQYYLKGSGTITANNMSIYANYGSLAAQTTQQAVISSISSLVLSGNLSLTSENYKSGGTTYKQYASFITTAGTVAIGGQINTSNVIGGGGSAYPTTLVEIAPSNSSGATLEFDGPTPLAGLTTQGTSLMDFNENYANVNYAGSGQTVYTSPEYYDLTLSGGTSTAAAGTLTIDDDLINSTTANFATNNTIVNIGDDLTNSGTVTQGSGNFTVTDDLTSSGNINCGSGTFTTGGQFTSSGNFTCSSGSVVYKGGYLNTGNFTPSTGTVFFTGTQNLQDNSTAGTVFNKVTFNSGTATIVAASGNFAVSATGYLSMLSNANLVAGTTTAGGAAYLTLLSTATSTATIGQITGTSTIKGNVAVQRYISGGSGYRGYRLLSSPINVSTSFAGSGYMSLAYLNSNATYGGTTYKGAFTSGPAGSGGGFQVTSANPIIYLYDESATTDNSTFVSGKNVGIYAITGSTVTILSGKPAVQTTGRNIPVGNSFLFYFIGNNSSTVTASSRTPENTTVTAIGYLNQGSVPVNFWSKANTYPNTSIPYHTGTGAAIPGYNQIGNPYPSTIDLKQVYTDNSTSISPVFWELNEPGGNYMSYKASDSTYSNSRASRFIVSGQGFIIAASNSGKTFTFKETEKVTYPNMTTTTNPTASPHGGTLLLSVREPSMAQPKNNSVIIPSNVLGGLHLQFGTDSINYTQTGIYFANDRSDLYVEDEDATDLDGASPNLFLSSYSSDGKRLSINEMGNYAKGKRIRLFIKAITNGSHYMSLADINSIDTVHFNVYLVDKYKSDSLDLVKYKSYAFDISADTSSYGSNRFVLAIEKKPLPPYKLVSFTGQKVSGGIQLNWQTSNESDYTGFMVQKLGADKQYAVIDSLQSSGISNYNYTDVGAISGTNTYRLLQNEFDGTITYSDPVTINYNNGSAPGVFTVYPNPARETITVSVGTTKPSETYSSKIYNTVGQLIGQRTVSGSSWTEDVTSYRSGVYIIELRGTDGNLIGKSKFVKTN